MDLNLKHQFSFIKNKNCTLKALYLILIYLWVDWHLIFMSSFWGSGWKGWLFFKTFWDISLRLSSWGKIGKIRKFENKCEKLFEFNILEKNITVMLYTPKFIWMFTIDHWNKFRLTSRRFTQNSVMLYEHQVESGKLSNIKL